MTDNRHLLAYTIVNHSLGRSDEAQDDPRYALAGGLADVADKLAARQADLSRRSKSMDGFNHHIAYTNFRIHSWHEAADRPWAPAPMGGRENYDAWVNGPGSPAL